MCQLVSVVRVGIKRINFLSNSTVQEGNFSRLMLPYSIVEQYYICWISWNTKNSVTVNNTYFFIHRRAGIEQEEGTAGILLCRTVGICGTYYSQLRVLHCL